jgi:hypothetical protein
MEIDARSRVMRGFALLALMLAAACDQQTPAPVSSSPPESAPQLGAAAKPEAVEGWETSRSSHALLGATLPAFKATRMGGGDATENDLRDHWTILGFWNGAGEGAKEEMHYLSALNSAVDQDPDLDLLSVYLPRGGDFDIKTWSVAGNSWPVVLGDDALADVFGVEAPPAYFLIGPDLTIEAYRGALSKTPDDGIKPVIRGVAEIKKRIAAPQ